MSNSPLTPGVVPGRLPAEAYAGNFSDHEPALDAHEARVAADRCYFCHDAPCMTACPTSIDIPLFIRQIATGTLDAAARTILSQNILGGMCARVCPTEVLCEQACVRNTNESKPVEIGLLQRFAVEGHFANPGAKPLFERAPSRMLAIALAVYYNLCGAGLSVPIYAITTIVLGSMLRITPEEEKWLWDYWGPAQRENNPVFGRLDAMIDFISPMWKDSLKFVEPNMSGIGGDGFLMIVWGVLTEQAIGKLFIAGIVPGIILTLLFILTVAIIAFVRPDMVGPPAAPSTMKEKLTVLSGSVGEVVVIFGVIMGGLFVATILTLVVVPADAPPLLVAARHPALVPEVVGVHALGAEFGDRIVDLARIGVGIGDDRRHHRLHRRQPHRKRACVVLYQDAEEALHGAVERPVHHQRLVRLAVLADVRDIKPLRQVEVDLHGRGRLRTQGSARNPCHPRGRWPATLRGYPAHRQSDNAGDDRSFHARSPLCP